MNSVISIHPLGHDTVSLGFLGRAAELLDPTSAYGGTYLGFLGSLGIKPTLPADAFLELTGDVVTARQRAIELRRGRGEPTDAISAVVIGGLRQIIQAPADQDFSDLVLAATRSFAELAAGEDGLVSFVRDDAELFGANRQFAVTTA